MKKLGQKSIGIILIVSLLWPAVLIYPKKTSAQAVPVHDISNGFILSTISGNLVTANVIATQTAIATGAQAIKEVGFGPLPLAGAIYNPGSAPVHALTSIDGIYVNIIKNLVDQFTADIVSWIDSGFEGQPAFMTDPGTFFLDLADSMAGDFIWNSDLSFLCSPFELDLRIALDYQYTSSFEQRVTCRLTDVLQNIENFAVFTGDSFSGQQADFLAGGWSGWISLANQNQYSTHLEAKAELSARIAGRQNIELAQLEWGSGFLSFQECLNPPGAPLSQCLEKGPIETPGKIIQNGLSDVLGSDLREWELADSFDAIIAALINQLVDSAMQEFLSG